MGKTTEEHIVTIRPHQLKHCSICHGAMGPKLQYTQPHPTVRWNCVCGHSLVERLDEFVVEKAA
jgi:hypothetical protein